MAVDEVDIIREVKEVYSEKRKLLEDNEKAKITLAERLMHGGRESIIEDIVRTAEQNQKENSWFRKFLRKLSKTIG